MDIVLANPGEGIEGGTVTAVSVKSGDAVKAGQVLVEVSTDKASMEVTAEADGTVETVHVKPGDKVAVGGKLVTISGGAKAAAPQAKPAAPAASPPPPAAPASAPAPPASAIVEVVLANPGEGIEGGTVTAVSVKSGDAVKAGQVLVEVSTDKASMEVTAEADGTVEAVHVKPGDKVPVGGKLVSLKSLAASREATTAKPQAAAPAKVEAPRAPVHASNGSRRPGAHALHPFVDVVGGDAQDAHGQIMPPTPRRRAMCQSIQTLRPFWATRKSPRRSMARKHRSAASRPGQPDLVAVLTRAQQHRHVHAECTDRTGARCCG